MTCSLRRIPITTTLVAALALGALGACLDSGEPEPGLDDLDDLYGMDGPLEPTPPLGKEDSEHRRGLWVNTNTRATQVWSARNKWEDTDTTAARAAGIAWSADSGLTWDEKYQRWIEQMAPTPGEAGYYDTFMLTTPWGKTLPSPRLECAELSMFLRITFAAWYELPFFLEAVDRTGARLYFGHNGVRTQSGRYANTPNYGTSYKDHTSSWTPGSAWPSDATLRKRKLGSDDTQPALGPDAVFGTFVDEIHLNKRAGYFVMLTMNYLGSMNLADTANTYHIVPEAVRPGDVLVERWQRSGIGHTLVVKEVLDTGEGTKDVTLLSGSMPRRQGKWESGVRSKQYFTSNYTGGVGTNSDGHEYAKLGGGLRRYRVTKNVAGYWTNTWMRADEAHWINSTDYARIAARPARFESMLGQVSPEQMKTELLAQIDDARRHLQQYPASCSARERRENGFRELYDVMSRSFGRDRASVDAEYRALEDYVFAELEYTESKTCCWNSTTSAMYEIIMDKARLDQEEAASAGECRVPAVFMNDGGYDYWRDHAAATGRSGQWVPWSEDETCSQRDVARDSEYAHEWTSFCALETSGGDETCGDAFEPNDSRAAAAAVTGTQTLSLCTGDVDWFIIATAATVTIEFSHAAGDLDLSAHDAGGAQVGISQSTSDRETLTVAAGTRIKVYGYQGATGDYTLRVQ